MELNGEWPVVDFAVVRVHLGREPAGPKSAESLNHDRTADDGHARVREWSSNCVEPSRPRAGIVVKPHNDVSLRLPKRPIASDGESHEWLVNRVQIERAMR